MKKTNKQPKLARKQEPSRTGKRTEADMAQERRELNKGAAEIAAIINKDYERICAELGRPLMG